MSLEKSVNTSLSKRYITNIETKEGNKRKGTIQIYSSEYQKETDEIFLVMCGDKMDLKNK